MNRRNDIIEIDLMEVIGVLFSKIWLILTVGVVCAGAAFLVSKFVLPPKYESTTKVYILNRQNEASVTYSDVQLGTQLTKDYAQLITSRYVLETVIDNLSLNMTYKELADKVSVTTPNDTRIVAISVLEYDPTLAMNIANAVREVASTHIQNVMNIEAVNIVETANLPTQKASPSVSKWTLLGGLAGLFVVGVLVFIEYLVDDTIKTSEDVQKYLGLSTLALIPMSDEEGGRKKKKRKKKR